MCSFPFTPVAHHKRFTVLYHLLDIPCQVRLVGRAYRRFCQTQCKNTAVTQVVLNLIISNLVCCHSSNLSKNVVLGVYLQKSVHFAVFPVRIFQCFISWKPFMTIGIQRRSGIGLRFPRPQLLMETNTVVFAASLCEQCLLLKKENRSTCVLLTGLN